MPNAEYVADLAQALGAEYVLPVLFLSFTVRPAPQRGFVVLWSRMRPLGELPREEAERPDCRTAVCSVECRVFEFESRSRRSG
ncbi:MAG: hypothetical protein ACP5I3_11880 [Thermoproteus sp.]